MRNAQPMPMPSIDGSQGVPMPTSLEPCIGDQCSESGAEGGYAVGSPGNPGEW
ncbi:MAG: hypothetical protein KA155_07655 [Alphaproteobacteria bacterium]|nr:hypothetical protein [Alphaproteobacteria bacterium]